MDAGRDVAVLSKSSMATEFDEDLLEAIDLGPADEAISELKRAYGIELSVDGKIAFGLCADSWPHWADNQINICTATITSRLRVEMGS